MSKANLRVHLRDIASIRLGYPFRTRIERDPHGEIGVIQMKDIGDRNQINLSDVYQVQIDGLEKWHLLEPHNILFRSKEVFNTAALVNGSIRQSKGISALLLLHHWW